MARLPGQPDSAMANGAAVSFGLGLATLLDIFVVPAPMTDVQIGAVGAGVGALSGLLVRLLYHVVGIKPPPVEVVPVEPSGD